MTNSNPLLLLFFLLRADGLNLGLAMLCEVLDRALVNLTLLLGVQVVGVEVEADDRAAILSCIAACRCTGSGLGLSSWQRGCSQV